MKKRIFASITIAILVFIAPLQIFGKNEATAFAKDEPNYIFYCFTQTTSEEIVEPTSYSYAGCVYNKGERVSVLPLNVPLSFNVTNAAAKSLLAASFALTPSSTVAVCGMQSAPNPNNAPMTVNYGYVCYQHFGYVTQYINGVAYHTYYDQWVKKAMYIRLQYIYK